MVPTPIAEEISRLLAEGKTHAQAYEAMLVSYPKLPEALAAAIADRTLPAVKRKLGWARWLLILLMLGSGGLKVHFMKMLPHDAGSFESLALPFLALVDVVVVIGLVFWRPTFGYYATIAAGFGMAVGIWMDVSEFMPIPLVAWVMLQMAILALGIPLGRKVGGRYEVKLQVEEDAHGRRVPKPTVEWLR
jgi:hypothetical protein